MADLRDQLQATLSGTYTLERELGGGGMSRVFVAEELRLKRQVVVKVLSPELAQGISVERFEREIQMAAALQQANIVPVLSAGDTDGLPFYTMPLVEGESLRARLGRGPLSIGEGISVLRDVTRALGYAHARGVVHRDIKPDNVLLSGGTAVVTDFGIAKALSASRSGPAGATLTQLGTSIGTPAYMAPEQAAGDPDIDHRADLYSLGAMAYELFTGQLVFGGRTPQRMLAAHMSETPKAVADLRADLPVALAKLIMALLEKDPARRPQSANDIAQVLDAMTSSGNQAALPAVLLGGPRMFRRALLAYAAAFLAVAILTKAAIVGIGLPDWVFPGSLIVMALGLPVVLWTGYVQRVARRALVQTPTFTPGGTPTHGAQGTIATMALAAAPRMTWTRTMRGGLYAMGAFVTAIVVFLVMRSTGIGPFGSLLASGKISAKDPILLTDLTVTNADSSLGRVVSDAVRAGLGESNVLMLLASDRISDALRLMQRPAGARVDLPLAREIAAREGVKAIVTGDITGVGTGYIVQLRLVSADSGTELASFRETGDGPRGLIDAADQLSRKLRAKAGESLRAVQASRPLAEVTTTSLEALRKYTEAFRATGVQKYDSAIALAREAIALDTGFALAYRHLSEALVNKSGRTPASDSAILMAYERRGRLSQKESLAVVGDYYMNGPGRSRAKAIAAFEREIALGDYSNTNSIGLILNTRRDYARAESLAIIRTRIEPTRSNTFGNLVHWQLEQGKLAAAESSAIRYEQLAGTKVTGVRAGLAIARDSIDRAVAILDSARRADPARDGEQGYTQGLAGLAALQGKAREAARLTSAGLALHGPGAAVLGEVAAQENLAVLLGPGPERVAALDRAVATPAFASLVGVTLRPQPTVPLIESHALLVAAQAYAIAGSPQKARELVRRFTTETRDTATMRLAMPNLRVVQGLIALDERRPQDALTEFRASDVMDDGPALYCDGCADGLMGLAFDALKMRDSAIARLAVFNDKFARRRVNGFAAMQAVALARLAELYEERGDTEKAAASYRQFIGWWKNADPELQPRVKEARRRLELLTTRDRK